MQFLIDDEIYLFQEFKFDKTGKLHEFEENKNIKTKITEEKEQIKKEELHNKAPLLLHIRIIILISKKVVIRLIYIAM